MGWTPPKANEVPTRMRASTISSFLIVNASRPQVYFFSTVTSTEFRRILRGVVDPGKNAAHFQRRTTLAGEPAWFGSSLAALAAEDGPDSSQNDLDVKQQ